MAATAASPTSIWERRAPRLEERSAARRTPGEAARPGRTRGRPICEGKPPPSIGVPRCRSPRASNSTCEPGLDLRGTGGEARGRHRTQGFQLLRIQGHAVFLDPRVEFALLRDPAHFRGNARIEVLDPCAPFGKFPDDVRRLAAARQQPLPAAFLGLHVTWKLS